MTQVDINHIVFDIGRVLLHYDPDLAFATIIPDAGDRQWFFDNVCTHEWNIEQDRGRSWREAEDLLIAVHPQHESNIRAFRQNWHRMVPHAYEGSVATMQTLIRQGHDVTLLTNFAADTFTEARDRFEFLNEPRGATVSAEVRLMKPEREIYETHVAKFALEPAATLFIDDSPANVEGAKAAGWQSILFTDPAKLTIDLRSYGFDV